MRTPASRLRAKGKAAPGELAEDDQLVWDLAHPEAYAPSVDVSGDAFLRSQVDQVLLEPKIHSMTRELAARGVRQRIEQAEKSTTGFVSNVLINVKGGSGSPKAPFRNSWRREASSLCAI